MSIKTAYGIVPIVDTKTAIRWGITHQYNNTGKYRLVRLKSGQIIAVK